MAPLPFSLAGVHISPMCDSIAEMEECALEILLCRNVGRVAKFGHNFACDCVLGDKLVEGHSRCCFGDKVCGAGEATFLRVLNLPCPFLRLGGPNECCSVAVHSFDLEEKSSEKRLDGHRANDYREAVVSAFQFCLTAVQ